MKNKLLTFYKNYDYNLKQLFSIRTLIISLIFVLILYGGTKSLYYQYKYYGKQPHLIESNIDLVDGIYARIDIEGSEITKPNLLRGKELSVIHKNLNITFIDTKSRDLSNKILSKELTVLDGKISSYKGGYKIDLGSLPDGNFLLMTLIIFVIFIIYIFIIFNDIATLKEIEKDDELHHSLNDLDFSELIKQINSGNDKEHIIDVLIKKVIVKSAKYYNQKTDLFEEKDFENFQSSNNKISREQKLKSKIKKLKKQEIKIFFENEKIYNTLILAYIIKKYLPDDNYNNYIIELLERKIENENGRGYIKKILKKSNYIYHEIVKDFVEDEFNGIKELIADNSYVRLNFYLILLHFIVLDRLLNDQKDIFTIFFYIINPFGIVFKKVKNKFKGF